MSETFRLFATAPRRMEHVLVGELTGLGLGSVAERPGGARFAGTLETAYAACLNSRVANRILLELARFPAGTPEALYAGVAALDWREHLGPDATLAVDCNLRHSAITHSRYAAQTVKDAVVDRLRTDTGARPNVDLSAPDVQLNAFLDRNEAVLYVDLSGDSLHRRGYRVRGVAAPLKENLAAAILLRAGWPAIAAEGGALLDPMCGSGTLAIEAALMAADIAPGWLRERFGFHGWRGHDEALWQRVRAAAAERRAAGLARRHDIRGSDRDRAAVAAALANVEQAGLSGVVHVERGELSAARPTRPRGLVVANPPYGQRLDEAGGLESLYGELGETLRTHFCGWRAAVMTGNPELGFRLGLRSKRPHTLYNGALECKLLEFEIDPARFIRSTGRPRADGARQAGTAAAEALSAPPAAQAATADRRARLAAQAAAPGASPAAEAGMLANRVRKNLRTVAKLAAREAAGCYRVYDADLPEYAVAVDVYDCEARHLVVQEYQAPASVAPELADRRLVDALLTVGEVLDVPPARLHLKIRERQRGTAQYGRQAATGRDHVVTEGPCRYYVNFDDYLDTGLFIDHRGVRKLIRERAGGVRFLNLFAYTGTASVAAALGGAAATTTLDLSQTYLAWAERNFTLNELPASQHVRERVDCLEWLAAAAARPPGERRRFDLIFLNPPVFSNSKRMADAFDIQRDAPRLIAHSAALLAPGGTLVFATSLRRFTLETRGLRDADGRSLAAEDVARRTLPGDFRRRAMQHHCWLIGAA